MVDFSDMVGTPFVYGGRGPDEFDCYGLVMACALRAGQTLPDFGFSKSQSLNAAMMGATMPQWQEMPRVAGAIALLRTGRFVSHVGYMVDADHMIHTWEQSGGVTVQRIEDWKQRVVGYYKYVGN